MHLMPPHPEVDRFYWAMSAHVSAPVWSASLSAEHIQWCRGHISREAAMPLLAAAALAQGSDT